MEAQTPIIDVRKVLREKAPRISKKIPACIVNYLIRTIHQDELNRILQCHAALDGVAFMEALIREFDLTLRLTGEEHLPLSLIHI